MNAPPASPTGPTEPGETDSDAQPRPALDPLELSRWLQAQLQNRLRPPQAPESASAPHAARPHATYFVIRSQSTGVLSVLAAASLGHDHDIVFGPQPFVDCLGFVQAAFITTMVPGTPSGPTSKPTHEDPPEHP